MTPDIERLIHDYIDGELSADRCAWLSAWLRADDANADRFAQLVAIHDGLFQQIGAEASETLAETQSVSKGSESVRVGSSVTRRVTLATCAVAALVLIGLGVWFNSKPNVDGVLVKDDGPTPPSVSGSFATIARLEDVAWADSDQLAEGDRIGDGLLKLSSGVVRLRFDDGVEVTLEGAAEYELIALGKTRLHTGLLTATVPPGAEGFVVDTPTAKVVDLGTAFGIELDNEGAANVSVFDGEVEVLPVGSDAKQLLKEGDAVRLSKGQIESVEFSSTPFERIWPVSSGIAGSTGAFRFAPAWPRRLSLVESDSEIFVVPEGYSTVLDRPLQVDATEPGTYAEERDLIAREIPVGTRVKTFLLQFNPAGAANKGPGPGRRPGPGGRMGPPGRPFPRGPGADRKGKAPGVKRIVGEITFDRPVLGLIVRARQLAASDPRFSRTRDAKMTRQLELRGGRLGDVLTLSSDRRSVELDLAVVGLMYDHVRVVIDDSVPGQLAANIGEPDTFGP